MNERPKTCTCGARLRWEYRGYPSTWVATCESDDCGHITTPDDQPAGLSEFLGIAIKPSTPPWIREFLKASAIEGLSWEHWPSPCPECEREQLVFTIDLAPIHEPRQATLCLNCGMVAARFMTQGAPDRPPRRPRLGHARPSRERASSWHQGTIRARSHRAQRRRWLVLRIMKSRPVFRGSVSGLLPTGDPGCAAAPRHAGEAANAPQTTQPSQRQMRVAKVTSNIPRFGCCSGIFPPRTRQKVTFLTRVDGDFAMAAARACPAHVRVLPTNILWDWHLLRQGRHAMFARCSLGPPNGPRDGASALGSADACVEVAQSPANPCPQFSTTTPTRSRS